MRIAIRYVAAVLLLVFGAWASETSYALFRIKPEDLAQQLQDAKAKAPLILNVGPRTLYQQAHIRGAEYIGATSSEEGKAKLRERVKSLPKNTPIVLYCGCCPWERCPNIHPAFSELQQSGFTNVKMLYVAHNIGSDWVDKGYPTEKGQ